MADVVSALGQHLTAGRSGAPGPALVTCAEVREFCLFQLAAWPETISAIDAIGAKMLGVSTAPDPGMAASGNAGTLLRVEPLKWWLAAEKTAGFAPPAIPPEEGSFLDLSHSRAWLKVGGDKADVLLNHFLPIDLRSDAFKADSVASTAFHHAGITLWRGDRDFNLLLPRSFAVSLWELLRESAMQYGLEVEMA